MIQFAVDWYPEQWDESLWEADCRRMKEMGAGIVRIGEFAWADMEPEEGKYTFDWLDRAIETAKRNGLKVILGTPTNCAPSWLYTNYPTTLRMDREGRRIHTGVRGHRCISDHTFRHYARAIIEQLAERCKDEPAVIGWQIDNELEANGCTCPVCTGEFVTWLKNKYGTLEALNTAWGTSFWSGQISDWDQISLQRPSNRLPQWYNPACILDVERWKGDSLTGYVAFQADLIRKADPQAVITTNSCLTREIPAYHDQSALLDVAAYDNYPPNRIPENLPVEQYSNAMVLDYIRGFKRKNFWVLEQLAAPMGCWSDIQPALEPGMIEGYAVQAIAHGADLLSFFRWRTAASGAEMFCYGILDQDNRDNRRLQEIEALIRRISQIEDLDQTELKSQIAILYSRDQEVSLHNQPQNFDYFAEIKTMHGACMHLGLNCDIIDAREPLEGYKIVLVPALFIEQEGLAEKLEAFARAGGSVYLSPRTGAKDAHGNVYVGQALPGPYAGLAGAHVKESDAQVKAGQMVRFLRCDVSCPIHGWADILECEAAVSEAVFTERFYKGECALARNEFGQGECWLSGVFSDRNFYEKILMNICARQNIPYLKDLPEGVEITTRSGAENTYTFVFNNTMEEKDLDLFSQHLHLQPLEALIIRNESERL